MMMASLPGFSVSDNNMPCQLESGHEIGHELFFNVFNEFQSNRQVERLCYWCWSFCEVVQNDTARHGALFHSFRPAFNAFYLTQAMFRKPFECVSETATNIQNAADLMGNQKETEHVRHIHVPVWLRIAAAEVFVHGNVRS